MPQIKTYEAGQLELRPTEIGVEATAAAGRRLGTFYNQVAGSTAEVGRRTGAEIGQGLQAVGTEAVNQITAHQISHGAATFAKISDDLTNQWNETVKNADPNDPSVAAKFKEEVLEPALAQWNSSFNTADGQKWAEAHVQYLRSHMFEKTSADMMTLAKQAASNNAHQTLNQLSNTVYNDPSGLKFALDTFGSSLSGIVDSSPNLKGTAAAAVKGELTEKGREQIVKAAAIGYITKTGQVPPWVNDPAYSKYVNGPELEMFRKNAEAQQKANLYYERTLETLNKQRADLAVHKDATDLMAKGVTVDPNNPNKLLIDPNFMRGALDIARRNPDAPSAAATVRTMIDWAESQQRTRAEPVVSDPATKSALFNGMFNPNKPTSEVDILKAEAQDKISPRDGTILRAMVKETGPAALHDPVVHSAIDAARERLGVTLVADGHERYNQFFQAFWPAYLREKNAGTLKANALDTKDPTSLISQYVKQYEPPEAQRMMMHQLKLMGISNLDALKTGPSVASAPGTPPRPASLLNAQGLQWNEAKQQWRDGAGNLYDRSGQKVK